jgi:hydrogenase maturation protease
MTAAAEAPTRIAVIGIGNVLLGDDGFGPCVVALLQAGWEFPDNVTLVDAGTPGLGLVTFLDGCDVAVLVDAVGATGRPGELRLYRGEDLRNLPTKPRVSPHDPAVQEALSIVELGGRGPRAVRLFGVIPESHELGAGLSPPVRAAATATAVRVVEELTKFGAILTPRPEPRALEAWWMADPLKTASCA